MQLQAEIDDLGFCPSFSCYFPDSLTAMAAAKVCREFNQEQSTAQFHEFTDVDEDDFEFSPELPEAHVSHRQIDLERRQFVFPVVEIDYDSSDSIKLHKFYVDESTSSSSSEADEFGGNKLSGFFCMRSPKADAVSSPSRKCKKSSGTTGSRSHGSRRYWRIHNFLRRSSSEGEESMMKTDAMKQKRNVNSGKVTKVAGESISTASFPSFHELFYVQKRAQQNRDKMKSFLPYRQDLVGFFVNINRIRNKKLSPF